MSDRIEQHSAAKRLYSVLQEEKALLRTGQVRGVSLLIKEKLEALQAFEEAVNTLDPTHAQAETQGFITNVTALAEENTRHFEAIRNGLASAINRIERAGVDAYVGAYSQNGAQVAFSAASGGYLKKV